jgi:hypothetical protein
VTSVQDLIGEIAAQTRLSPEQARKALAGALSLIEKHADPQKAADLMAVAPGAQALAAEGAGQPAKGGLLGGLMKAAGGSGGAAMSDAMAMAQSLAKDGIEMSDLQALLPVAGRWVKAQADGRNLLKDALASVPGVGAMLGG